MGGAIRVRRVRQDESFSYLRGYAPHCEHRPHLAAHAPAKDLCGFVQEDSDGLLPSVHATVFGPVHQLLFSLQYRAQGALHWVVVWDSMAHDQRPPDLSHLRCRTERHCKAGIHRGTLCRARYYDCRRLERDGDSVDYLDLPGGCRHCTSALLAAETWLL